MEYLQQKIEHILQQGKFRTYEKLTPRVPVRLPYGTLGGTPTIGVKAVSVGKKKNELYLHLFDDIYPAEGDLFEKAIKTVKEADRLVYSLMRAERKDIIDILSKKTKPFPHEGTPMSGDDLANLIRDRKVTHLFIQLSDESLIPITDVSLGFDWDRNKLFFSTEKRYTCSPDILQQHIEVSNKFMEAAKKVLPVNSKNKATY